jgi:hypothetical protein
VAKTLTIDANLKREDILISKGSFRRGIRHGVPSFAVFIHNKSSSKYKLPSSPVSKLLQEFGDVFPDELPNGVEPESKAISNISEHIAAKSRLEIIH